MELQLYPNTPGVYFLVSKNVIVYVGKTRSLRSKWQGARHEPKIFDRLFYVECPLKELSDLEAACITYFTPEFNKQIPVHKEDDALVKERLRGSPLLQMRGAARDQEPYAYRYPRPSLTVDCVIFGFDETDAKDPLKVLLIKRKEQPFIDDWALPGGFVEVSDSNGQGESLLQAAERELKEETGLSVLHLEQLFTFGDPGRDPRGRVISVAYFGLVRLSDHSPVSGSDASDAQWVGLKKRISVQKGNHSQMAFDHEKILKVATKRLRDKIQYSPIGLNLLPEKFTLSALRSLYEAVLDKRLDPSNFAKRVLTTKVLVALDEKSTEAGRPATLYRFDLTEYQRAVYECSFNVTK